MFIFQNKTLYREDPNKSLPLQIYWTNNLTQACIWLLTQINASDRNWSFACLQHLSFVLINFDQSNFPCLNIGLMGQRKAQFSANWKTHFLCFVVTKLSPDKRVHSINSCVIHLTIAAGCFWSEQPGNMVWGLSLSVQMKNNVKHTLHVTKITIFL